MFPGRLPFHVMGGSPPPFMGTYPGPPPPSGPRQYPASPDRYHSSLGSFLERHCYGPCLGPRRYVKSMIVIPSDVNHRFGLRNEPIGSKNPAMTSADVEIVVPQAYLGHVYGTTEGLVVVSHTLDQAHFAQSLLHAFSLCGQS